MMDDISPKTNKPLGWNYSALEGPATPYPAQPNGYNVGKLDVHDENSAALAGSSRAPAPKSASSRYRRYLTISLLITLTVLLITGSSIALFANQQNSSNELDIPQQDVNLDSAATSLSASTLQEVELDGGTLLVNGDVVAGNALKAVSGTLTSSIRAGNLKSNQTVILPDASGTICLDTNNCGFVTQDILEGFKAASQKTIQGTDDQISVSVQGDSVTLSTTQNLNTSADVQFGTLKLSGNTISSNGRSFQFPTGGPSSQTICTNYAGCSHNAADAEYLTLASSSKLANERTFNPGPSLVVSDNGANSTYDIDTVQDIRVSASPTFDSPTFNGNLQVLGSSVAVGEASATSGSLRLYNSASQYYGQIQTAALGQNTSYNLPDTGNSSDTICLANLGNCGGTNGALLAANNLSDLNDAAAGRANLALGANDSPDFAGLGVGGQAPAGEFRAYDPGNSNTYGTIWTDTYWTRIKSTGNSGVVIQGGPSSGTGTVIIEPNLLIIGAQTEPYFNLTFGLGDTDRYFTGVYAQRYNLNSSAYIDGSEQGNVAVHGDLDIESGSLTKATSNPPASATDNCSVGTIEWGTEYIYVCVADNTWRRSPLSTW